MNVNKNETTITIHKGLVTQTHDQCKTLNNFNTIKSIVKREPSIALVLIQPVFVIVFKYYSLSNPIQPTTAYFVLPTN
jgi:hypothetical protein